MKNFAFFALLASTPLHVGVILTWPLLAIVICRRRLHRLAPLKTHLVRFISKLFVVPTLLAHSSRTMFMSHRVKDVESHDVNHASGSKKDR